MSSKPEHLWELSGLALYPASIRDKAALVVVDPDVAAEAPSEEHEYFHAVRVQLRQPTEEGLMSHYLSCVIWGFHDRQNRDRSNSS